ncbi:hypothetical protein [Kribbella caucasensis]|uniref:hypothetical protein n=1 Tax=Kribbella caucasensis TaxID=2512215 RepID=UPI001061B57B|nr:hypothetical protein [Kribbella sp. VKM Ac-2527]
MPPTGLGPALSPATPATARSTRKWGVAAAVAVVVVSAVPLGWELNQVHGEQQGIEAVIREPLQTDLDGTWPYSVDYSSTGIEYAVLEPPTQNGDWIANVNVTVRRLDTEPCTGFADVTESALTGCTALGSEVWQARDQEGKTHYFVHADQHWAHVAGPTYGGEPQQRASDARALQVAQTLRPRSAWPLAAASAECGFCEWLR